MTATMPLSEMCWRNPFESYPLSAITYSPFVPADQLLSLCDIVLLSCGQRESEGVAMPLNCYVDLGAEPSPASAERLR